MALNNALKISLMTEIELYNHVNNEEFEIVRLNKCERRREILKFIRVRKFILIQVRDIDDTKMISCVTMGFG